MARGGSPRASEVLAERIRASATAQGSPRIVVLIDGHSGSGKTTLATELAYALKAQHVALDAFYPGWGGLEVGSAMVRGVLDPDNPGFRRWDWKRNEPAEWRKVNGKRGVVVEGSGCMSRANRELATFGVWIRLDQGERKRRAVARDGSAHHQHWDRWAAQEQAFFARERPDTLADAIMDGRSGQLLFRTDLAAAEE
ncbi:MAG TPA: ATP-binding protein [Pseudolysinimonas sp.]|nr:ATP-binding protein [Pseudolysinimonas sp.]